MGQVLQAGAGQAPARQALLRAGLADTTPATTINRVCGSGLKAIMFAAAGIRAGDGDVYVAGGMESMNQAPFLLRKARFGYRLGNGTLEDSTVLDGLWCAVEDCHMGTHAERVAISNAVSREDQDALALESHVHAVAAIDAGRFDDEMAPVTIRDAKGRETVVSVDEGPRRDTTAEALAGLKPVFDLPTGEDRGDATTGTVTAGNAPGITDGGAATVVASERAVEQHGLKPLARIVGYAQAEVTPRWLFLAPIQGVRGLEAKTGLSPADFDLIEINEAFAAQTLADGRELGFDWSKVNVNGGAIALGHPIGASGRADRRDAAPRAAATGGPLRDGDVVPRRRGIGRDGVRARLTQRRRRQRYSAGISANEGHGPRSRTFGWWGSRLWVPHAGHPTQLSREPTNSSKTQRADRTRQKPQVTSQRTNT